MGVTKGTEGAVYITSTITAFAGEATSEYQASSKIFLIEEATKQIWSPNTTIVASVGTIDRTWQDDGVDYFTGRVKLTASGHDTAGLSNMTLSGVYVKTHLIGYVQSWSMNVAQEVGEVTSIGDAWKKIINLGKSVSISLNRWAFDTHFLSVTDTNWMLLKLVETSTAGYWAKGRITGNVQTKAVGAVDNEAITFEADSFLGRAT